MEEAMRRRRGSTKDRRGLTRSWALYFLGRLLQVTGLLVTLVAATAFFGTPSTIAMLWMMLVGVLFFLPGWLLARKDPRGE
jgi:hypothetical protein